MSYNYKSISNSPEERQRVIYPYCYWADAFTNDEIDKICRQMSESELSDGYISSTEKGDAEGTYTVKPAIDNVRKSQVSFHTLKDETRWIFERLNSVIEQVNNRWYNFDLNGYDQFQYTEYYSSNGGHYGWHMDTQLGLPSSNAYSETRKLSLTLLLNEPDVDFEGGQLQFGHESNHNSAELKKGTIILFPSFELHQVAPVTTGTRKSIVVWVLGPKWR
jgi:predicted 2-oxoglutarate/Fe(II)-dependent dioxygenase YbiX